MQFKVPQDVQREDRIVGPLTLKQLIICGIGGGIAYAIYVTIGKYYALISTILPVGFVVILTILFAFIRPHDIGFAEFLLIRIENFLLPNKRFWIQSAAEPLPFTHTEIKHKTKDDKKAEAKAEKFKDHAQKLRDITKVVDTAGKF